MFTNENDLIFEAYANNILKRVKINDEWITFYYPRADFRLTSWINLLEQQKGVTKEILNSFFKKVMNLGFEITDVAPGSFKITHL